MMRALLLVASVAVLQAQTFPGDQWPAADPRSLGLDPVELQKASDYAEEAGGAGVVVRAGKLAHAWGDTKQLFDLKSSSKSFGATALALAVADGKLTLDTPMIECLPSYGTPPAENKIASTWRQDAKVWHLATHTAGFEKPGGYEPILFAPGTRWSYSDGGPNWLADCITLAYRRDVEDLLFERVFEPIGVARDDLRWRDNQYRPHEMEGIPRREFGSGVHANVEAMARLGLLYLRRGQWGDRRLLPAEFVEQAAKPYPAIVGLPVNREAEYPAASSHYGLLWWNNADGSLTGVPRDAYWSWGLFDSLIVVIPSLDLVAARAGTQGFENKRGADFERLAPFLRPLVKATGAPYPPSPAIKGVTWAPKGEIVRKAEGSDNWPMTWGDDDAQYTAYGDGWGFEPKVDEKLSLGLAKISGGPDGFTAVNIRSETGERIGQGPAGEKASGMLMVDGVLYMWIRNARNARLLWSEDRGATWEQAGWRFRESFGAPTFLNFGKNYAGARDGYVYVYSHDDDSAYVAADRMVLARVLKEEIREQEAYEYFAGLDAAGNPTWTSEIADRAGVFENPGRAYRSGITYDKGLRRYLWCQVIPGPDTRFEGGFGVYDAPEPWGPWTTAFYASEWDVGPGETCGFPSKWMSRDGKTVHMVFSGDDFFSVREATLE